MRALEPPVSGFGLLVAIFKSPALPFVDDIRALAREMVEGLTIGELKRRSTINV